MKRFLSFSLAAILVFGCNFSAFAQENENAKSEADLYAELMREFDEAAATMPPFVVEALNLLAWVADAGDKLSDDDKATLDDTGKTYVRAWYANMEMRQLFSLKTVMLEGTPLVAKIRNLTALVRDSCAKISGALAKLGEKLGLPNLGSEFYAEKRFQEWDAEVQKENSEKK